MGDDESQAMIAVDSAAYLYPDQASSMEFASCRNVRSHVVTEQSNLPVMLERDAVGTHKRLTTFNIQAHANQSLISE